MTNNTQSLLDRAAELIENMLSGSVDYERIHKLLAEYEAHKASHANAVTHSDFEFRAAVFAAHQHASINQTRKYTGEPYINHPAAVADLVRAVPHTEEMLAVAWLHDTVEDTGCTLETIVAKFGATTAYLVSSLTDLSTPADGNRATRKAIDRMHIAAAAPEAKTIKLADLIDNSYSIIERDPKFAETYLAEKALLLEVLREGDQWLWNRAKEIVALGVIDQAK